jgi:subtilase family serine protease
VDENNRVVLKGNVHPLARPEFDQGAVADGQPLNRMLLLLQRSAEEESALRQLLDDQQSKSSPNYHVWLTPEQFGKQFGPADADVQTVTQWLTSQGFTGINMGPGRQVIEFSGTSGQVRSAFRTEIHRFVISGKEYTANAMDPQIPAALAPVVAGVVSLHSFPRKSYARILGQFRRTLGETGLEPLFTFPNPFSGRNFYGLGPGDFATIYNSKPLIAAGNDGTGQTIAIVGETNLNVQDVQQFRKMFGLPANFNATNVVLNGEDPGVTSFGEEGEADLDVEWSGAVAPGATVKFVVSASTPASAGIDLSALYIVERNLAAVMSESYGDCEKHLGSAGNAFYNSLWEQAAAQGITVVLSSGDGGSAGCDDFNIPQPATQGLAVSGLASTPFNVSLGGTDFDQVNNFAAYWNSTNDPTGTSAKSYVPEIPWNENCAQIGLTGCGATAPLGSVNIVAGSGGTSGVYGKPKWQMGVAGMPNDNHRDQPDISLFASPGFNGTGYVYCQSDQTISGAPTCDLNASSGVLDFGIVGGTSASAPAFAGIMALVNQKQATVANPAPRQGNANYVLYALAKKSGASCTSSATVPAGCVFNDVTKGSSVLPTGLPGVGTNSVPCQGGSPNCSISVAGNTGVLVDPSHTSTEAWTATAGYDMTTGLGTLNANNLATSWGSVSSIPTTTTLTLTPTIGITHGTGENVTVGITVKPNTGTAVPAGDVSLIATFPDGSTHGFDQFTLSNGAVTGAKTQSLPGGTYTVSAHYTGDGTNAPSDSTPTQVTVGKESSQTFIIVPSFDSQGNLLNGNATSVTYGSNYIVRTYVTDKNGVASTTGPPSPTCYQENVLTCPSGTVTLTDNGALLGTGGGGPGVYNLNSFGYTRELSPNLLGGVHSLVANYSGDNSYQSDTSTTDTFTVTPASTQLVITNNPSALVGSPLALNILGIPNVPTGATATGSISVFDGSTLIAGPVPVACIYCAPSEPVTFSAPVQVTFSNSGNHPITAKYSGDADYAAATSSVLTIDALYPTTMNVTANSSTINYGNSVTITAQAISRYSSPAMTGQIGFAVNGSSVSGSSTTLSTDASGNQILTATLTLTPQAQFVGIQAGYSGDTNFEFASNSIGINVVIPDFSLQDASITVTAGQSQTVTVNVTPLSSTPSPVTLGPSPSSLPSGMSLSLSSSTVNLNGVPVPVTITLTTTGPIGGPVAAAAVIHVSNWIVPKERWTWWSASFVSGFVMLFLLRPPRRTKRYGAALFAGALFVLTFVLGCGGGGSGGGGGGGPVPTSITLTTSNAKVPASGSFILTATVTSTKTLTGTVNIFMGHPPNGEGAAPPIQVVNGKASATVTNFFGPGTYEYWAQYTGDPDNLQSTTTTSVQEVITGTASAVYVGQTGGLSHQGTITINLQ